MTAQVLTLNGIPVDPRIAGLERTPGFWRGRAAVRKEEGELIFHVNQQKAGVHAQIAQAYIIMAMELEDRR